MDRLDTNLINHYFNLDAVIRGERARLKAIRHSFYQQSFYGSSCAMKDDGTRLKQVRVDVAVVGLVTTQEHIQLSIDIDTFRQSQFARYLCQLSTQEVACLQSANCNEQLTTQTVDEINEIEDAVMFRFFDEIPDERISIEPTDTLKNKMASLFEAFGDD